MLSHCGRRRSTESARRPATSSRRGRAAAKSPKAPSTCNQRRAARPGRPSRSIGSKSPAFTSPALATRIAGRPPRQRLAAPQVEPPAASRPKRGCCRGPCRAPPAPSRAGVDVAARRAPAAAAARRAPLVDVDAVPAPPHHRAPPPGRRSPPSWRRVSTPPESRQAEQLGSQRTARVSSAGRQRRGCHVEAFWSQSRSASRRPARPAWRRRSRSAASGAAGSAPRLAVPAAARARDPRPACRRAPFLFGTRIGPSRGSPSSAPGSRNWTRVDVPQGTAAPPRRRSRGAAVICVPFVEGVARLRSDTKPARGIGSGGRRDLGRML